MASIPNIIGVSPAPEAQGIPIGDQLRITFDQEMDLDSLNTGTVVLTGPDEAPVFGPIDVTPFDSPGFEDEDILSSPYFKGYVKGTITYSRVDASGGIVDDSVVDLTGDGTLWRTVALFTPDTPLKPNVQYTAIILGDEAPDDDFDTGVKTRTVFDPEFTGSGSGRLTFSGGYTGTTDTSFVVEITVGGPTGTAEYIWWDSNDPLTTYTGITTTGERELDDGVYITCDPDGTFTTGDKFEAVVIPAITLPNNYRWSFFTGSGSVLTPPSEQSTTGIESITTNVLGDTAVASFSVSSISPVDRKYGVAISTSLYVGEIITITFSAAVDATTLAGTAIDVRSEVTNGDDDSYVATGALDYVAELTSPTVLTITLDPGQLYTNNIVIVELASTVADTDGNTLGSAFSSYFSTLYTPLYSSLRRVQLDIGPLIVGLDDETIMLAIFEASIQAAAISFTSTPANTSFFNHARRQYTTCLAEAMLVRAILGESGSLGRMSKKLGGLEVSRGGDINLVELLGELEDCVIGWTVPVNTGGDSTPFTGIRPGFSVKGSAAEDAIVVGRQWEPTSGFGIVTNREPAANVSRYNSGRKDLRTFRTRGRNGYYYNRYGRYFNGRYLVGRSDDND